MSTRSLRPIARLLALASGLLLPSLFGAWTDETSGLPVLENITSKEFTVENKKITLEDKFGRVFVGGYGLQVFDGQSWRTFPVGNSYGLGAMAFGDDGRLWAAAMNEVGYFDEPALGIFKYHSLIGHLPLEQQAVGDAWGCAQVGRIIFFVFRNKVLRWDGTSLQMQSFPSTSRIFPIKLGNEYWFHHLETGLYRFTESGPRLEIADDALPQAGILGLARDAEGLLVASGLGVFRPGNPARRISDEELSQYISINRLASFAQLPDGNYSINTLNGGIVLTGQAGSRLRTFSTTNGLPSRTVNSMRLDSNGYLWCATPTGIFNMEAFGRSSVFNSLNGLKGPINSLIRLPDSRLWAVSQEGIFQLEGTTLDGGQFRLLPQLASTYAHVLPITDGLLLSRHGGMDFFDGMTVRPILKLTGNGVYYAMPARHAAKSYYLSETRGLANLAEKPDGAFTYELLANPPDFIMSMHEDASGRIWLGTYSKGAFLYDPLTKKLSPVNDPISGEARFGRAFIVGTAQGMLLLTRERMFLAKADGTGLKVLNGTPALDIYAARTAPAAGEILIAFNRANATIPSEGLGVLTVGESGQAQWRELDVPALGSVGSVNTMEFTTENGRPILWIGGRAGALRLDYDALPPVQKPTPPFIRLDTVNAGQVADASGSSFAFQHHRLHFHVFTGEYTRTKDWLIQMRLGNAEWSALAARRSFEFTNLSEGDYRFQVRAVNSAGLASEPAVFAFRILPPWYRSGWAFAGYFAGAGLAVFVVIRVRERRIQARNLELESLVTIRTAELVKANAAKDEFLAGISHEIRNPMNGVIGIADNFRTDGLDQESRRKFSLLRQCATHLSSLLEDILDFSKVQAGAVEIEAKPFDLIELMDSITAMTAADSEQRGIPVEIAISPAVPARLVGDPKRVRQILLNFVSNALKFSGRGQVSVTVWCQNPSPASAEVIFAVSDEGPGISPEEQKRLFSRFERGAAAQRGRVPGTGLGLALSKGLAEKMGGRIWLESEPGRGSCFSFSAPFAIAESPAPLPPAAAQPVPVQPRSSLVVDDQDYNRVVLTDLLETLGFTVHQAGDGTAALALAGRQDFDAVFLDYNLPGLSGLEVSRSIRALPNKSAKAVIIATTAFNTPEKRSQCLAAGMNAFLGKPVTMERLRQALFATMPAGPAPASTPERPAADGLANLRLLAGKKNVPFSEELALYLSEFEVELENLHTAMHQEDSAAAVHGAHQLYGRCAFIAERELEQTLRKIEADAVTGHWDGVRQLAGDLQVQVAGLRVRLASSVPAVRPG